MFCPKCGTQNDDAAKFCSACGAPLQDGQPTTNNGDASNAQPAQSPADNAKGDTSFMAKHRIKLIIGAAVIIVAIAGIALFALLANSKPLQGTFAFEEWATFHVDEDGIQLEINDFPLGIGELDDDRSNGSNTIYVIDADSNALGDRTFYVQIPNNAKNGSIEGEWIFMAVWPEGPRYSATRYQFNADGTAYYDDITGTNPTADLIENQTSHDEIRRISEMDECPDGIESISSTETTWHENNDGFYTLESGDGDMDITIDPNGEAPEPTLLYQD